MGCHFFPSVIIIDVATKITRKLARIKKIHPLAIYRLPFLRDIILFFISNSTKYGVNFIFLI